MVEMATDIYNQSFLNIEFIQEKLDEGYKYILEASEQDIVLVLGNTGVGKSTTCNYLLGYEMEEYKHYGKRVVKTVSETLIKIGHSVTSETLYAKPLKIQSKYMFNKICLVDCPGFLGNRTIETQIVESISTELVIRKARQVKAILILISLNVLKETRVLELRELVKTLIALFKNPVEMVLYSIFVITKKDKHMPEDEAREVTIGAMQLLREHCAAQSKEFLNNSNFKSSDGLTHMDYDRINTYFSAVLDRAENIIFVDPLDNGESRKLIMDQIIGVEPRTSYLKKLVKAGFPKVKKAIGIEPKPITIDDFSFSESNEDRVKFSRAIYDRASEGIDLVTKIQDYCKTYENLESEIINFQTRLPTLETYKSYLQSEITKMEEDKGHYFKKMGFQSITKFEAMIEENEVLIKSKQNEIKQIDENKKNLNKELKSLDTDDPMMYIRKSIDRYVSWWKFFGWEEMEFNANTGDTTVEIINVIKYQENGAWYDENDQRKNGIYKIKYKSNYVARPAKAGVETYIKTREEEGNKIQIEHIKKEQLKFTKQCRNLHSQITDLESKNQALHKTIQSTKSSENEYKNNLKQRLEECEKDIERFSIGIINMQNEVKGIKCSGISSLQEFDQNRHKFETTISMTEALEFSSKLINNFVSKYNDFLPFIDSCRSIFGESESNLNDLPHFSEGINEESGFSLKDPITGAEIKDLVVTLAGTPFDKHSLLKQFDINMENVPPFILRREDDSFEEIQYLSWQKIPDIQNYLDSQRTEKLYKYQNSMSSSSISGSEILKMSIEELEEQKDTLSRGIKDIEEELMLKRTNLDKVCQRLHNLRHKPQTQQEPE